jgi:SHS2 domain-containing protein
MTRPVEGSMGDYEFLDAIALADCAVELAGTDLDDLFETAARALAEVMVDPATVPATVERVLTLSAPSIDLLLYDWLGELIYLKDHESLVFTGAEVTVHPEPPCSLTARLIGGPIDPERTALRADPKAVTFHQFALEPRNGGWRARVVIDI